MLSKAALGGIWVYQHYISPHKGFRCAYSVRHGGTGCSGYAKYAIRNHGLWRAVPIVRERLRACKAAYADLREQCHCANQPASQSHSLGTPQRDAAKQSQSARQRRRTKRDTCYNACSCCGDCGSSGLGSCAGRGLGTTGKDRFCDVNPCDGDIGIGGCDCSVCSCG